MEDSPLSRLPLFPVSTLIERQADQSLLSIAGCDLADLAEQYGTPLYLYDRATLDGAVAAYRVALQQYYPGTSRITYAGKAFLCLAIAQWSQQKELWLDCTGAGELAIASLAGVPRSRVLVHGVNKGLLDLQTAIAQAGTLVIDNLDELNVVTGLARRFSPFPDLWLRLRPGLAVDTHAYTQTGQDDSKFGMVPEELQQAVRICLAAGLSLKGIHFHQGSHFHDPAPLLPALETTLDLLTALRNETGWYPQVVCPGGGWGVAYHETELPHPSLDSYVRFIAIGLLEGCQKRELPLPDLHLEPGRSLVARAGVCLYRVGSVKVTSHRRWLLLDGGMADNPRPALYGARYSALPVSQPERSYTGPAWLGGPFCESGDWLIADLPLPEISPGELIAIPVSGAYQLSMGSNYNGARKPAVLWLENGIARLIQRRETFEDLYRRDLPLFDEQKESSR